jgi:hypothetical protein
MANKKITELPAAGALTGAELAEAVQGGVNVQTTLTAIAALGGGGGGGHVIEDEGTPLTQRADLNFVGGGVTAADAGGKTVVTIPAATAILATTITNGDTTHAPDGNAVFDALALKQDTLTAANFGDFLVALTGKTTPVDADVITLSDSAASDDAKKVTLTNFKAFLKTYFDTLYNALDQAVPSTAGGTITLDMNNQKQRSHVGSATFSSAKAIALSNTTSSLFFNFIFEITSVSAVITPPSDWVSSSPDFNGTAWTPPTTGKFEFGGSFDDTNNIWYIKVSGPFI